MTEDQFIVSTAVYKLARGSTRSMLATNLYSSSVISLSRAVWIWPVSATCPSDHRRKQVTVLAQWACKPEKQMATLKQLTVHSGSDLFMSLSGLDGTWSQIQTWTNYCFWLRILRFGWALTFGFPAGFGVGFAFVFGLSVFFLGCLSFLYFWGVLNNLVIGCHRCDLALPPLSSTSARRPLPSPSSPLTLSTAMAVSLVAKAESCWRISQATANWVL